MSAKILINDLRCESLQNPVGIDTQRPQFSWKLIAKRQNVRQSAYQIQVSKTLTWDALVWDSGKVISDNSIHVQYAGSVLDSRQIYFWRARIWDENDSPSDWSSVAFYEMGLLSPSDWAAHWIEPKQAAAKPEPPINMFQNLGSISPQEDADYSRLDPAQYLRKEFASHKMVAQARIYATAHGVYQLSLNGARIGDTELAPEITAYDSYLQYQTYDVTRIIVVGKNVLGVILGDGWYRGRIGLPGDSCQYGDKLALLLQLEIEYEDGSREMIVSDESFKSSTGALVYSDLFIGERYDATLENAGWNKAAFDDSAWRNVSTADFGFYNLVAQYGEPLRIVKKIKPVAIIKTPNGETVIDLGQNIHGKIRMSVQAEANTEIVLDHAEMLDAAGNFMQQIRGRNKDQRDVYVCKGAGVEVYEPFFTTHGFRYVRITGYPDEPTVNDFVGLVIASDLFISGSFTCSDERINQLQENIRWSQTGNFVSIPTDCPQRERAGFTGDAQVFIPTACFNMDVHAFFIRWLRNLQIEQREDGQVPATVPYWRSYIEMFTPIQGGAHTSAGWGDACIIIPWTLYQTYGNERMLAENYATMLRWLDYVRGEAESGIPERLDELSADARERQKYLWNTGFHFGDWLIPSLTGGYSNPFDAANATKEVVASAFYAYTTELMAQIAAVLGKEDDAQRFAELNEKIRSAFAKEYLGDDGSLPAHYQGMYVMALKMKLVPAEMRSLVTEQLVGLIAENGYRLDTGFVSVPYLLDVLSENGRQDVAYKLLFQTQCPSWLYEVVRGATTIWETWDAIAPNGEVTLASFNHYAFGAVGDWLYRHVAGLDKAQAGYKHIVIHPHPDERLTHAKATYQSVYGEIISGWELKDGLLRVDAKIPPNTTATLRLVGANRQLVASEHQTTQSGNDLLVEVGSGTYRFEYPYSLQAKPKTTWEKTK